MAVFHGICPSGGHHSWMLTLVWKYIMMYFLYCVDAPKQMRWYFRQWGKPNLLNHLYRTVIQIFVTTQTMYQAFCRAFDIWSSDHWLKWAVSSSDLQQEALKPLDNPTAAVSSYIGLHNHINVNANIQPSPHHGKKLRNELIFNAAPYLCTTFCIPVELGLCWDEKEESKECSFTCNCVMTWWNLLLCDILSTLRTPCTINLIQARSINPRWLCCAQDNSNEYFHLLRAQEQQERGKLVLLYYVDAGTFCSINEILHLRCVCVCVQWGQGY